MFVVIVIQTTLPIVLKFRIHSFIPHHSQASQPLLPLNTTSPRHPCLSRFQSYIISKSCTPYSQRMSEPCRGLSSTCPNAHHHPYQPFFRANFLFSNASSFGTLNVAYSRSSASWFSFSISSRSSSLRSSSSRLFARPGRKTVSLASPPCCRPQTVFTPLTYLYNSA